MSSSPNILAAVYDLLLEFTDLDAENIFQGYNNRTFLPSQSNEFAIISLVSLSRRGTNTQNYSHSTLITAALYEAEVQLDFYSKNLTTAQNYAQNLNLLAYSPITVDFLQTYGLTPLYASAPRDLSQTDQSEQYVKRFMLTLTLSYWASYNTEIQYFEYVTPHIENIDVDHSQ